jgi:hypothetical protein
MMALSYPILCKHSLFARICSDTYMCYFVLQLGAAPISSDVPVPSVDELVDQVADVLDFFGYCITTLAKLRLIIGWCLIDASNAVLLALLIQIRICDVFGCHCRCLHSHPLCSKYYSEQLFQSLPCLFFFFFLRMYVYIVTDKIPG